MGVQDRIGTVWISVNNWNLRVTNPVTWNVGASGGERGRSVPRAEADGLPARGPGGRDPDWDRGLRRDRWYLVIANHRSWVDILVLQHVFNRRIPFLKFFLKKELFWVPLLGLAWWALDYPFLKRSASTEQDLEAIRRAAEKFKVRPVSVMNFVEGTRFTDAKRDRQRSPYTHLLKPKPGGMTFILASMKEELQSILDVTIAYSGGTPTFWQFLCGRTRQVRVRVREIPVEDWMAGDFGKDKAFRRRFMAWQKGLWEEKDGEMASLHGVPSPLDP